jgi:hypothetical protein
MLIHVALVVYITNNIWKGSCAKCTFDINVGFDSRCHVIAFKVIILISGEFELEIAIPKLNQPGIFHLNHPEVESKRCNI